jgi:endo-alpha-1,4-polygalactosaminidase (GH114 family)
MRALTALLLASSLIIACSETDPTPRADAAVTGDVAINDGGPGVDHSTTPQETGPPTDAQKPGDSTKPSDSAKPPTDQQVAKDGPAPATIWKPKPGTTWHWQLTGKLNTSVNATMYDIDLFDQSKATIAGLKAKGRIVICYFSAGSYEDWRPDAKDFPAAVKGSKLDGWNELWLDIRTAAVKTIMGKRLDLAKSKGCDGVEPDNVDGYTNSPGFSLKAADQLAYNKWLAAEAHKRGLSVGLKNDLDQVKALVSSFDWALNEECVQYNECSMLSPFISAGKAVFHVEYKPATKSSVCSKTKPLQLSSMIKNMNLDAWFDPCWP